MVQFQPAIRQQTKLKLAITGPSGSGKTYSALDLMEAEIRSQRSKFDDTNGFVPNAFPYTTTFTSSVVDTENGSASLYADRFKFDILTLSPPYTIPKYLECIKAASSHDVLIVDSLSHGWMGEGGLLAKKEALDSRGGNPFANWAIITKEQEILKSAILNANIPAHLRDPKNMWVGFFAAWSFLLTNHVARLSGRQFRKFG